MSRCNAEYTRNFIWLNRREQRGFTNAFVEAARRPDLTDAQRRTLQAFEDVWFAGRDFTPGKTFDWFLRLCRSHGIAIRFEKKPSRRSGGGGMVEVEWTQPDEMGSFWPVFTTGKKPNQTKRTVEEIVAMKAALRLEAKLDHMQRLGIGSLNYRLDVHDRVKQLETAVAGLTSRPEIATPMPSNVVRLPVRRPEPDYFTMPMADILAMTVGEAA